MQSRVDRHYRPRLSVFGSVAALVVAAHVLAPEPVAAQPALACGQTVTGTIGTSGQQDQFTFLGGLGDVVSLTLVRTGVIDPAFTAVVTLVGPGTNNSRTSGVNFYTLPATAVYTVVVHDVYNTGRGSYSLRLGWALPLSKQCGDRYGPGLWSRGSSIHLGAAGTRSLYFHRPTRKRLPLDASEAH